MVSLLFCFIKKGEITAYWHIDEITPTESRNTDYTGERGFWESRSRVGERRWDRSSELSTFGALLPCARYFITRLPLEWSHVLSSIFNQQKGN